MGRWFGWLQKDSVAELKEDRKKLLQKRNEHETKIKNLDECISAISDRIVKLESENKGNN